MGSLQDLIFSSGYGEQRWADQISKNFDKEVVINISDVPVSVFNVPKSISDFKPEAYIPQAIALGPYHHLRPEYYHMERYKIAAVRSFLDLNQILNFQKLLIDNLKIMEPTIRACYHKYLDLDDDTLAWIIAIDGLFLLDILRDYGHRDDKNDHLLTKLTRDAVLCRDILVLENQIPVILLKEIRKTLHLSPPDGTVDSELFSMLHGFCEAHSPLKLARISQFSSETTLLVSSLHLLDLMYHLILNNRAANLASQKSDSLEDAHGGNTKDAHMEMELMPEEIFPNMEEIVTVSLDIGAKALRPAKFIQNVPWVKISNILGFKTVNKHDEGKMNVVEEIKIPSVSSLSKFGGVKFSPILGGISDIKFVEKEATLYLPVITLNANSEAILRNLVAYESAISDSSLELGQYVDLMSGIIDTAEDAKLLTEKGIINGELTSDKIANLFSGMNKSSVKGDNNYKIVEEINAYFSKKPRVRAYRFVKKKVYSSWKVLTLASTLLLLLLLILQSFCDVYGCPRLLGTSS